MVSSPKAFYGAMCLRSWRSCGLVIFASTFRRNFVPEPRKTVRVPGREGCVAAGRFFEK
jgi:hypothetical protein